MASKICPICKVDMSNDHDCFSFDASSFSLELELLGLPFDLEPYGPIEESAAPAIAQDPPELPSRSFEGFGVKSQPAPLFLRL